MTRDFKSWIRAGWLTDPLLDDRDAILFPEQVGGKFVMMHRPLEWAGEKMARTSRAPGSRWPTTCSVFRGPAAGS